MHFFEGLRLLNPIKSLDAIPYDDWILPGILAAIEQYVHRVLGRDSEQTAPEARPTDG